MQGYFKRTIEDISTEVGASAPFNNTVNDDNQNKIIPNLVTRSRIQVDLSNLPSDPSLRHQILDYDPNDQDIVRRAYLQNGPCQPSLQIFPQTVIGGRVRRFSQSWFTDYKNWLEYSVKEDAVYCLLCYLFRPQSISRNTSDAFIRGGFRNWKHNQRLREHSNSDVHKAAYTKDENLMNQNQHIAMVIERQSTESKINYRHRLNSSLVCIRYLLHQGLPFRGHDESEESMNKGNFLELLHWLAHEKPSVDAVVLKNAPLNNKMTSPEIQKDIVNCIAVEIIDVILQHLHLSGGLFALLIDEARDTSIKEQMAIVLRFVDETGSVIERFVGMVHVPNTTSISLKTSLDAFFNKHKLSMSKLRGQGYDGASNMQGAFNGLKTLVLHENKSAFYVHCFAHQLQLALVRVAKDIDHISEFFYLVNNLVNLVGASCKRRDILREKEANRIFSQLESGELSSGRGLNQERSLKRPGDTRWGSHYGTLINLIVMFPSVIDVLTDLVEDISGDKKGEPLNLIKVLQSYDFIFILHLMKNVLAITNDLSKALQRKDQDILNALMLVKVSKERLNNMRASGWDTLLNEVGSFCIKQQIPISNMNDNYLLLGRSRRGSMIKNLHHYRVDLFYLCLDKQIAELNNRFDEVNSELLLCMSSLSPVDSFASFDKVKLVRLSEFYPDDFSEAERMDLYNQLEIYEIDMKSNDMSKDVKSIGDLARKMVLTKKNIVYNLVYKLITLSLILPVSTATVERAFSAMNIVKNDLRNRMGDEWLSDSCVAYIEKDIFKEINNDAILDRFQNMRTRRGQL